MLTPDTAQAAPAILDTLVHAVEPWATGGTLVNLHGRAGDETDRARAWDTPTYQRLVALSRRMDPAGLLRYGHAIGRLSLADA